MSTRKGYVAFEWTELDFNAQLNYLLLLLQNLPAAIPTGTRLYKFHRPIGTNENLAATCSQQKAVLKYLEATFGALDCDGDTLITFQERGDGLDAVVQVIRANISAGSDEDNLEMRNWALHLIASASRAYKQHNCALPDRKRVPKPKNLDSCGPVPSSVTSTVKSSTTANTATKRSIDTSNTGSTSKRAKKASDVTEISSEDDDGPPARATSSRKKKDTVASEDSDFELLDEPPAAMRPTGESIRNKTAAIAKAPAAVASIFLMPAAQKTNTSPTEGEQLMEDTDTVPDTDPMDVDAFSIVESDEPPVPSAKQVKLAKKDKSKARVWLWDPDDLIDIEEPPPKNTTGRKRGRPPIELMRILTIPCKSHKTGSKRWRCSQGDCRESFSSRQKERVLPHHVDECEYISQDLQDEAMALLSSSALGAKVEKQDAAAAAATGPTTDSALRQTTLTSLATAAGKQAAQDRFNLSVLKLYAAGGLAARLLDRPEWVNMIKTANNRLDVFSSTTLTELYMPREAMRIRQITEGTLKELENLTISYDGGTNKIVQSVYTVHVTAPDSREPYLMLGHEASGISHDAEYISEISLKVMRRIGVHRFIAVVSDSTGATRKARELLEKASGILIGLADAPHHINLTLKDLCAIKHFALAISQSRLLLRYFSISSFGTQRLQSQAQTDGVTRGLESIGKTRFASINRAGSSILRNLPSIKELVNDNVIFTSSKDRITYLFLRSNSQYSIYHATQSQLVGVLTPLAKAQKCLESTHVHPGHVLLFWLAALSTLQELFNNNTETLELPQDVMGQVISIINRRFEEMFAGPDNAVFKAALFLDPAHVRSPLWRRADYVYSSDKPRPDDDLRSTVPYYADIGAYLLKLLEKHILGKSADIVTGTRPKELTRALKFQLPAYARQEFPFNRDASTGWRAYWSNLSHHPDASVLAFLAIKLLSPVPNSMAEERTMSAFTHAQNGRPKMQIRSLVTEVQVKQHYEREERAKKPPVAAPDLLPFRELAARVRAEVVSSAADRFSHPQARSAPSGSHAVHEDGGEDTVLSSSDTQDDAFSTEFNAIEALEPAGQGGNTGSVFEAAKSVDLKSVLLRDLLSDFPLARNTTAAHPSRQKGTRTTSGIAEDFTLDAADFDFNA